MAFVHGAGDVGEQAFPGHDAMVAHALREPREVVARVQLGQLPKS